MQQLPALPGGPDPAWGAFGAQPLGPAPPTGAAGAPGACPPSPRLPDDGADALQPPAKRAAVAEPGPAAAAGEGGGCCGDGDAGWLSGAAWMEVDESRDTDRARALKRAGAKGTPAKDKDGLTAAQRKERDAKALQEKQAKKQGGSEGGK
ncbi:hypothetical protein Rsub_09862 [Raphidocelis subcapitata]|uniref:Small EDRK-rich factor-like N-terminal domain-containing protein n=1 Tax=Raphidocelis subcapitata TaxID=307507 RepID=A0A2V0PF62_9CHLO|nr:hypothetical protein Rsub_09862 [Raphidocelis subcapitata]|eukprot:GBF96520.1 hypothetical protein Rsub_09862 [Raphidocelis subcapitata]